MNKLFGSVIIALVVFTGLQMSFTSCSKTNTNTVTVQDTVTKTVTDTIVKKDTLLSTAILTANNWTFQYVDGVEGNSLFFYTRGGSNNTQVLDNSYFTFLANGTGMLYPNSGPSSSFTWQFTDSTYTSISWNWELPTPVAVTWQGISYKNGNISLNQYFLQSGNYSDVYEILIPK
jgi:hypothetical protein